MSAPSTSSASLRMPFVSTRGAVAPTTINQAGIDQALLAGLAPDGGLYVPAQIPQFDAQTIAARIGNGTLAETAAAVLAPYFVDSRLHEMLPTLCARAYDFDAPLVPMRGGDTNAQDFVLELFHGPTAAFKDYAARFLAECLAALGANKDDAQGNGAPRRTLSTPTDITTILVATSGDTGAAVAGAFHRRVGFNVVILYPHGRVSPRQAHGLECWGDNVRTFRIDGSFDDCQRMAKAALSDTALRAARALTSANSISLGRLLPQVAYYAHTAGAFFAAHGQALNLIIPTGNLGNAAAAFLAKRMGLPIGEIVLATNANDVLPRYFDGGEYAPRATIATLANAMDVGAPSNFERLRYWHHDDAELRASMRAFTVDDATIRTTIATAAQRHGIVPCPHTACGLHVLEGFRAAGDTRPWTVVATAHPAKFETIVEPLVGHDVPPPPALAACLAQPAFGEALAADDAALREKLLAR
jgi:threonine synthase